MVEIPIPPSPQFLASLIYFLSLNLMIPDTSSKLNHTIIVFYVWFIAKVKCNVYKVHPCDNMLKFLSPLKAEWHFIVHGFLFWLSLHPQIHLWEASIHLLAMVINELMMLWMWLSNNLFKSLFLLFHFFCFYFFLSSRRVAEYNHYFESFWETDICSYKLSRGTYSYPQNQWRKLDSSYKSVILKIHQQSFLCLWYFHVPVLDTYTCFWYFHVLSFENWTLFKVF